MMDFEYSVEVMSNSQTEHLHKLMSDQLCELFPNIKKGIANSLALSVIVTSFTPKEDILNLSMDTVLGSIVKENIAQFSIPNDVIKIMYGTLYKTNDTDDYVFSVVQTVHALVYGNFLNNYLMLIRKINNFNLLPIGINIKINDEPYIPIAERKVEKKQKEVIRSKVNHLRLVK